MRNLKTNLVNLSCRLIFLILVIPQVHAVSVLQGFKGSIEKGDYTTELQNLIMQTLKQKSLQ